MIGVNFIPFKAIPDVITCHGALGPMIPLADHLFSVLIFPIAPLQLRISSNVLVENDDREVH